jgi:NADPH:quinone reductase-like Zn-dependent oxidoreductase
LLYDRTRIIHAKYNHPELNIKSSQGALQQYVRVPADHIASRPSNISAAEACICLAALTAYQALFDIGKLEEGQTVLINGGSSSVGAFAIQLAKAQGIRVVATASAKNEDLVRSLGADEVGFIHSLCIKYSNIFDSSSIIPGNLYIPSSLLTHQPLSTISYSMQLAW